MLERQQGHSNSNSNNKGSSGNPIANNNINKRLRT